jgi:multiple sugar transport system permease protein
MTAQAAYKETLRKIWKRRLRRIALPIGGVLILALMLFPIYLTIVVSLEPSSYITVTPLSIIPHDWVIDNYTTAIRDESGSLLTSLLISLGAVALSIAVGVPGAYGLTRYGLLRGRGFSTAVITALLVTQMVPGISLSLAFYNLFLHLRLLNTYWGLILAESTAGVPFMVLVVRAYMRSIPPTILDAAAIDGCSESRTFRSIVVPLAVPGIVTASLFVFLGAWSDFLFAFTLTNGTSIIPITLGIYKFLQTYVSYWGPLMATVVFAAIPAAIILVVAQRFIVGGLRAGGLR